MKKKKSLSSKTKKTPPKNNSISKDKKTYIIDTNIILNDYTIPFQLRNSQIVIPQIVINELDRKRDFQENKTAAYNARSFGRKIRQLIKEQRSCKLSIPGSSEIIMVPADVDQLNSDMIQLGLEPSKADSAIVATAWRLKQQGSDVTLLTNDTNMWVTATALSIHVEDYEVSREFQELYTGVKIFNLEVPDILNNVYAGEEVFLSEDEFPNLYPHQILVLKCEPQASLIVMFEGYDQPLRKLKDAKRMQFAGVRPLNKEQGFAFELLSHPSIACVTLAGRAGTGKSMVALSYAVHNLKYDTTPGATNKFNKIIIVKPVIPVGRDVGFLPGTLEEKLQPWMESFRDSLDIIFKCEVDEKDGVALRERSYDYLLENGVLEFQTLTFMRGRSIQNTLIILDECQNCSAHEIKTLLTRVGENSKVICLGDVDQIDAAWLSHNNNGLAYLIERGKESDLIGHITLIKSQRSKLADWAGTAL